MGKLSNEIKTGIAVLASVLILLGIFLKTGDIGVKQKGYTVKTRFQSAAGIKQFAPVRLAGVEVGEVRDVKLLYEADATVVEATLWVEQHVKLRKDAEAMMSSLGLMGEKYVEIRPGKGTEFVEPGGTILARDPVNFDELMEKASVAMDEATATMKEFKSLAVHADELLVEAKPKVMNVLTNLDGILDKNRPKLDNIMSNLEVTSEYFKEFSEDVRHHPWKVLIKGKELTPEEMAKARAARTVEKARLEAIEQKARQELLAKQTAAPGSAAAGASADDKKGGFLFFSKQ